MSYSEQQEEDHYERELKNREALIRSREDAMQLREEMMVLMEKHAREMALHSNSLGTKAVENCHMVICLGLAPTKLQLVKLIIPNFKD